MGAGYFRASRNGGKRKHSGTDYLAEPGEEIYAPVSGVCPRVGFCYSDPKKSQYRLIELLSGPFLIRIMYVEPGIIEGSMVRRGDIIGRAQNIAMAYPDKEGRITMMNHVHMDVRIRPECGLVNKKGIFIDPSKLVGWK